MNLFIGVGGVAGGIMARFRRKNSGGYAVSCARLTTMQIHSVHKDKPPGIFDLSERSVRYAAGFCFVVGFVISVIFTRVVGNRIRDQARQAMEQQDPDALPEQ